MSDPEVGRTEILTRARAVSQKAKMGAWKTGWARRAGSQGAAREDDRASGCPQYWGQTHSGDTDSGLTRRQCGLGHCVVRLRCGRPARCRARERKPPESSSAGRLSVSRHLVAFSERFSLDRAQGSPGNLLEGQVPARRVCAAV